MLHPGESRHVSGLFSEIVDNVITIIVHPPASMGKAHHACTVGTLPGKKRRSARRTGRTGGKAFSKEHSLFGESLHMRGGYGVPVWLNISAGIV